MFEKIRSILSAWTGSAAPPDAPDAHRTGSTPARPEVTGAENGGTAVGQAAWKEKALSDFETWLQDLPEPPPGSSSPDMDACDLYTLLSEFTALRQEIRMQNREQHRTIAAIGTLAGDIRKGMDDLDEIKNDHRRAAETTDLLARELRAAAAELRRQVDESVRQEAEKRTVMPFLDVRDALMRGRQAAREAAGRRRWFRQPSPETAHLIEGYEMALRRFDRALAAVGIQPVNAQGRPFDPATMRAVDTCSRGDMEKGCVAAEPLSGFIRGEEVVRTAEVIVNQ